MGSCIEQLRLIYLQLFNREAINNNNVNLDRLEQNQTRPENDQFISDSPRREGPRNNSNFSTSIPYQVFKIGIIIGISIVVGAFLSPLCAMVVSGIISAVFSACEQYIQKGEIDFKRIAFEFAIGFAAAGFGKVIGTIATRFIPASSACLNAAKEATKNILSKTASLIDTSAQGAFSSAGFSAYDDIAEKGNVNIGKLFISFVIGGITGFISGAALNKAISKLSGSSIQNNAKTVNNTKTQNSPKPDSVKLPPNFTHKDIAVYLRGKYGEVPKCPRKLFKWYRKVFKKELQNLENQFKVDKASLATLNKFKESVESNITKAVDRKANNLLSRVSSGKVTQADLIRGSEFRKEVAACLFALRRFNCIQQHKEADYFKLYLIIYSRPKFGRVGTVLQSNKSLPKVIVKDPTVSPGFCESTKSAVYSFPKTVIKLFKRVGTKFYISKQDSQLPSHSSGARCFSSRTVRLSESKLIATHNTNATFKKFSLRAFYKLAVLHEGGHALDRALYYFRFIRKLDRAKDLKEYLTILGKTKPPGGYSKQISAPVVSNLRTFRKLHAKDVKEMNPLQKKQLSQFITGANLSGAKGVIDITASGLGRREAMAEIVALILGKQARIKRNDFPRLIPFVEKIFARHLQWKLKQAV